MSKLIKNLFLQGASGMLGNQLVYRRVNGQTIVSSRPERRSEMSDTQKRQNMRFKYATVFGKNAIADEVLGPIYAAAVARMPRFSSAYTLAVTDYLKAPEIGDIVLPSGASGSQGLVEAYEEPQLAKVAFDIIGEDESVISSGEATPTDNGIQWEFTLTQDIPEGGSIRIRAYDLPGNVSTKSFTV
ncbi:MAG: hypothetical protein RLQ12_16070 [Cyclobacteriaceae bacterium]